MLYTYPAEKPNEGAFMIWFLAALKRHTHGNLQSNHGKFTAILDIAIIGIADHNSRRFEPVNSNRDKAKASRQYSRTRRTNKNFVVQQNNSR